LNVGGYKARIQKRSLPTRFKKKLIEPKKKGIPVVKLITQTKSGRKDRKGTAQIPKRNWIREKKVLKKEKKPARSSKENWNHTNLARGMLGDVPPKSNF